MGGGSLIDFFQAALALITGELGIILMGLCIGFCGVLTASGQMDRGGFGRVLFGCGVLYGAAWLAQELTGGA